MKEVNCSEITLRESKNKKEHKVRNHTMNTFRRNIGLVALILSFLFLLPATVIAQTEPHSRNFAGDDEGETIVVHVWAESMPGANSGEVLGPALSKEFVAASLRTMTGFREWQRHLERTFRNGYPLEEEAITFLRERAADRLILASLAAATDVDRAALNELAQQYENLRLWSASMLQAKRKLEMAKFYMSPTALENDELFQRAAGCANFLTPMLASGHLREDSACR